MDVQLVLADQTDAYIIKNMYPLYLHDLSEFDGECPNEHGILTDPVRDLVAQGHLFDTFWQEQDVYPYLIVVDDTPAGFNIIARRPRVPVDGIDAVVQEFFLMHAFRGIGVGEKAAIQGFDQFHGRWEVVTYPNHPRAIAFWRKVMRMYVSDHFTETEGNHPWGRKVIFRFDNRGSHKRDKV